MLCQMCKTPHGTLNKLEGVRHLQEIKRQGRLGNIDLEQFKLIENRQQLQEMIMDSKREHALFVRTSAMEGDVPYRCWEVQPREKFPLLSSIGKAGTSERMRTFFGKIDKYREIAGQSASQAEPLVYMAIQLPDDHYNYLIEVPMSHDLGIYDLSCAIPEKRTHSSENVRASMEHLMSVKVTFSNGKIKQESPNHIDYALYTRISECSVGTGNVKRIVESIPDIIGEFSSGISRLRMAVYENNPNPVAFDWILDMDKIS